MTRRTNPLLQAGQVILFWLFAWSCILAIPSLSFYPSAPQESLPKIMIQGQARQQQHRIATAQRHESRRTMAGTMELPAILSLLDGSTRLLQVHTIDGRKAILLSSGLSSASVTELMSTNSESKPRAALPKTAAIPSSPSPLRLADDTTDEIMYPVRGQLRGSTVRYIRIPVPDIPTGWCSSARAMGVIFTLVCFVTSCSLLMVKRAMGRYYKLELRAHEDSLIYDIERTKSPFVSIWEGDLNKFDI